MHAVINCDVLHQHHHLLRKSRLIKWMCMLYYKLIIFIYVPGISISEHSTGGLTLSHNSVFVPS